MGDQFYPQIQRFYWTAPHAKKELLHREITVLHPNSAILLDSSFQVHKKSSVHQKVSWYGDTLKIRESYDKIVTFSTKQLMMINQLKFQRTKAVSAAAAAETAELMLKFLNFFTPQSPYS